MKFRKKPVVIEAVLFEANSVSKIQAFVGPTGHVTESGKFAIRTLEGTMYADLGDWIIRGVKGEFYPCKPDIFEATYDPV